MARLKSFVPPPPPQPDFDELEIPEVVATLGPKPEASPLRAPEGPPERLNPIQGSLTTPRATKPSEPSTRSLAFTITGKPAAWARASTNGKQRFNSGKHERGAQSVSQAFAEQHPDWTPWEGPVSITVYCYFLAPKDYWDGKACTKRPDLDNLVKLIGDALNGVAYRDDAQIITALVGKRYTTGAERTEIDIEFAGLVLKPSKRKKAEPSLHRELTEALCG